uniref:hypothetical protein n=1 Tax=Vibrio cholerae TaxID=666 RepID=UPI003F580A5E
MSIERLCDWGERTADTPAASSRKGIIIITKLKGLGLISIVKSPRDNAGFFKENEQC